MKAVVAAFNQEKALVGAFSVITNLRMELFEALLGTHQQAIRARRYSASRYNLTTASNQQIQTREKENTVRWCGGSECINPVQVLAVLAEPGPARSHCPH